MQCSRANQLFKMGSVFDVEYLFFEQLSSDAFPQIHTLAILHHLQDTPEIDLAVYQEMWFPVAVVAGITVILIFLAIVCLVSHSTPNLMPKNSNDCCLWTLAM